MSDENVNFLCPPDVDPKRGNCQLVAISVISKWHGVDVSVTDVENLYREMFKPGRKWSGGCSDFRALALLDKIGLSAKRHVVEARDLHGRLMPRPRLHHWSLGMNFQIPTMVTVRTHAVTCYKKWISDQSGTDLAKEFWRRNRTVYSWFEIERKPDD